MINKGEREKKTPKCDTPKDSSNRQKNDKQCIDFSGNFFLVFFDIKEE
jgi:hypothetical protein